MVIKNIIFDIGGVMFDDSKHNIEKLLSKNVDVIYKKAYGDNFKNCLLGNMTVNEHITNLQEDPDYKDIEHILSKNNLSKSYPIIKDNFEYILGLKEKGYKLYLLTNITKDSYEYIDELIHIDSIFEGGIYSYQENVIKPNPEIYNLLINKYNLDKNETIFFDDRQKNVDAANAMGIRAILFRTTKDIEDNLM